MEACFKTRNSSIQTRRIVKFSACLSILVLGTAALVGPAFSTQYQPIDIAPQDDFVAGAPLPCQVTLEGAPVAIHITSDPPGAVTYDGTVDQTTATVLAATSSDTPATPITLYVTTDGATTVEAAVESAAETAPTHGKSIYPIPTTLLWTRKLNCFGLFTGHSRP